MCPDRMRLPAPPIAARNGNSSPRRFRPRVVDHRHPVMRVDAGIAVAGEVFGRGDDAFRLNPRIIARADAATSAGRSPNERISTARLAGLR